MKRREAKFVHASPRMSPDQIKAAPRLREDRPRTIGKGLRERRHARWRRSIVLRNANGLDVTASHNARRCTRGRRR